jgi:putative alpha-1,2-mannosidase
MSAWYIFQSLGFFPNAGQDLYLITSPVMQEATLKFENGHNLIIRAKNASDQNIYIQSASLNGKPLNQCFFRHTDIASGGLLEFVMGPKPSTWAQ